MLTETIENYLKAIYHLSEGNHHVVSNKDLSMKLNVIPATVTEALKKLYGLNLVEYEKSYGTRLSPQGIKMAIGIVRRHRIWETYLVNELGFGWDEVHEIAEELEHIKNDKLIQKLSEKLGNPQFDPHGDPIPNEKGILQKSSFIKLSNAEVGITYKIVAVSDHSKEFLKYLEKHRLIIGSELRIKSVESFDSSLILKIQNKKLNISSKVAECVIVKFVGLN
jgi:DtxR family Mn-dependent transcriptional regulator